MVNNITIANTLDSFPNASFSRLYNGTSTDPLPAYLNHGVTIQDSSGRILACGHLETLFAVEAAYKGKSVLNQVTQFHHPGIRDLANNELLHYNIVEALAGICSSDSRIFNPWMAPENNSVIHVTQDPARSFDFYPVGNLPNHAIQFFSILPEVPLIGNATILGHTVSLQFCCYDSC